MVKPLGLTIDPEGIHIRVKDLEETDHNESMVWISKDPKDILRIAGLDFRIVKAGFSTKEESKSADEHGLRSADYADHATSIQVSY